jgi:hypothetical protein
MTEKGDFALLNTKKSVQKVLFSSIRTIPSALEFHQFSQNAIFNGHFESRAIPPVGICVTTKRITLP